MSVFLVLAHFMVITNTTFDESKKQVVSTAILARGDLSKDYSLVIKQTVNHSTTVDNDKDSEIATISIWSSKDKIRTDIVNHVNPVNGKSVDKRLLYCRNCERSGYRLHTTTGGDGTAIYLVEFRKIDDQVDKSDTWKIDWRTIGLLNGNLLVYHALPATTSLDLLLKHSKEDARNVEYNNSNCVEIKYCDANDKSECMKCLFGRDVNLNPVYHELSSPMNQNKTTTEISYQKILSQNIWFPKTIRHVRMHYGKVAYYELLTIEKVELNTPVPNSIFTFAGLDLDDGQPIALPEVTDPGKQPTWTKKKVDHVFNSGKQAQQAYDFSMDQLENNQGSLAPDVPPPSNRWLYFVGAGILVVMAGALIIVARKSRK